MPVPTGSRRSIEVTFEGCVQDAQDYGSDSERMVSRLFFWVRHAGAPDGDFLRDLALVAGNHFARVPIAPPEDYTGPVYYAEVRQRVGEDFETGRIEVGSPVGYAGPFDQAAFARAAVEYFRAVMTESGEMLRAEDGSPLSGGFRPTAHVRLRHNATLARKRVTIGTP
ncbi:MAG TPA: hypothetical protein VIA45_01180 [Thermoanaerobaculia bacterium]|jgi:hypothetical protein